MKVQVMCLAADGQILGLEPFDLEMEQGKGYASPIVTIAVSGVLAEIRSYFPDADVSIPHQSSVLPMKVKAGWRVHCEITDGPWFTLLSSKC